MNPLLLIAALTLGQAADHSNPVDSFQYPTAAEARKVWVAKERTAPVDVYRGKAGKAVRVEAAFQSNKEFKRAVIDREGKMDLSAAASFSIDMNTTDADSLGHLSLYFHSVEGWYVAGLPIVEQGWKTLHFEKSSFRPEGNPSGWDQIDRVRIVIWRNNEEEADLRDVSILLKDLRSLWNDTAIVLPDNKKTSSAAYSAASTLQRMLEELGMGVDRILESSLVDGSLGDRRLVILPLNRPSDEVCRTIETFVSRGGKVYLQYGVPSQLQDVLGFQQEDYFNPKGNERLATIQFETKEILGLPEVVEQASWNIYTAKPSGHGARVIGVWHDRKGRPTTNAAMLLSDRAAYLSHIALADDWENKRMMLAAVLGKLNPKLWNTFAEAQIQLAQRIGHCHSGEELAQSLKPRLDDQGREELGKANDLLAKSRQLLSANQGYQAMKVAAQVRQLRVDVYLRSQPSPTTEARAFWNHSGTGIYPGDWDRTCRELSEAGFNMILPNMLWAGVAHYPSDVLPRSITFEQHGDQIEQCLAAAKKHGLEVHVWKVNHNPGSLTPPEFLKRMREEGRTQVEVDGTVTDWLNPAHPKNFQMEVDSMLEVVRKYDVDGIHFDYIRYPNDRLDYSDFSRKKFESDTGLKVKDWPTDCHSGVHHDRYRDWRVEQITRLVEAVSRQAREIRPNIKISAAVFRDHPSCRTGYGQDWPKWAEKGYVDFLCPMDYTSDDEQYVKWLTKQKQQAPNLPIYPGIGAVSSQGSLLPDRVTGQIHITRQLEMGGFTVFDLSEATAKFVLPAVRAGAGRTPAKPPHQ